MHMLKNAMPLDTIFRAADTADLSVMGRVSINGMIIKNNPD